MVDILSKEKRSWNMSQIKSENTKPEKIVRSLLHRSGYRFRIHNKKLPGKPDIVLPKYRTVIFIHGCFWHRHKNCKYAYNPQSRKSFWQTKFESNTERDKKVKKNLKKLEWKVLTVWECEIKNLEKLKAKLIKAI